MCPISFDDLHPRTDVELKAELQLEGTANSIDAKITNISVSGASILASTSVHAGSIAQLSFELEDEGNRVAIAARATVMWVDQRSDNYLFEIGVSFDGVDEMDKQYLAYYVRNLLLA